MVRVARTIREHWDAVLRWFTSHISNGMLEAIKSLIQAAKGKARGYPNVDKLITMTYPHRWSAALQRAGLPVVTHYEERGALMDSW
jgi:hypothetical protein